MRTAKRKRVALTQGRNEEWRVQCRMCKLAPMLQLLQLEKGSMIR